MTTATTDPLTAFGEAFRTDGFGVIRGAADAAAIERLRGALVAQLPPPSAPVPDQLMVGRLVQRDPLFADLAAQLALVRSLREVFAGTTPRLICSYGHLKPARTAAHTGPHSDVAHLPGVPHHQSTLMVKVAYALTPTRAGNGATCVFPGTHRAHDGGEPAGAPVELDPGDMLLFHANLRHTATANPSVHPRLGLWFVYAVPWMRTFPGEELSPEFLQTIRARAAVRSELNAIFGLTDPYATG